MIKEISTALDLDDVMDFDFFDFSDIRILTCPYNYFWLYFLLRTLQPTV